MTPDVTAFALLAIVMDMIKTLEAQPGFAAPEVAARWRQLAARAEHDVQFAGNPALQRAIASALRALAAQVEPANDP